MIMPWTKRYEPRNVSEIVGQRRAVGTASDYVRRFPKVRKKALLLYGPPGTGKTCVAKAIAKQANLELVELNASDCRSSAAIKSTLMPAVRQGSLSGRNKLILLDEIDGLSGRQDRGGAGAVAEIIQESRFPIILTANDPYADKLKALRRNCELVELQPVAAVSILQKLKEICSRESVSYELPALQSLSLSANGDLRAAITDLQMLSSKTKALTREELDLWGREQKESIFAFLKLIFRSFDSELAERTFDYVDKDLEEIMLWLDQNLPLEYKRTSDLALAYRNLAHADIFLSRIRRRQHWRFFVYAKYLSIVGVQQAKSETSRKFLPYRKPELLLKLFIRAAKRKKMRAIAQDLSEDFHTSGRRLQEAFWPYYSFVAEKKKSFAGLNL